MKPVRVMFADEHVLVRSGLRCLLEDVAGVEIVGEAVDGQETMRLIAKRHPDVALMNVSMPGLNGLEAAQRASKRFPRTRIIMFSTHSDEEDVYRALRAGASGYLQKDSDRAKLEGAIRAVARGDKWLGPLVSSSVEAALARGEGASPGSIDLLTTRQREVLQLIAEGYSTKQIAARLQLSPKTVETHRAQVMDRLDVRGVPALVRCAIRMGLVRIDS